MLGWDMSAGITVYGNGGMNTDYPGGQIGSGHLRCVAAVASTRRPGSPGPTTLCGAGKLGMNLEQLIIAPTFAMKVNKNHSFGGSLLIGYQKFKAYGLSLCYGFTPNAANLPMRPATSCPTDNDTSWGYGLKFGWMGKVTETVTLGASYTTKMKMKKFDKYKDCLPSRAGLTCLRAESGHFGQGDQCPDSRRGLPAHQLR
jgi:long-chain fatty acid transport protein